MNPKFSSLLDGLEQRYQALLACRPFKFEQLSDLKDLPVSGIYLFTEAQKHLYVGRSNSIRKRLQNHCRPSSNDNQAAFAFLLAREASGALKATYKPEGSRKHLMSLDSFKEIFDNQKARLRTMDIRVVGEADPNRQALLEMYASVCLETPYNSFNNH